MHTAMLLYVGLRPYNKYSGDVNKCTMNMIFLVVKQKKARLSTHVACIIIERHVENEVGVLREKEREVMYYSVWLPYLQSLVNPFYGPPPC